MQADGLNQTSALSHVRQSEAALLWRDLPNGYTNITHLAWYEYFTPEGDGYNTGLVRHDINSTNTPELPERQPAYCGVVFQYTLKSSTSTCEGGAPGISINGTAQPAANTTATVPLKINPRFWATQYEVDYQPLPAGTSGSSSGHPPQTDFAAGAYASRTGSITKLTELTAPQELDVKLIGLQGCTAKAPKGAMYEFRASAANYEVNLPGSPGPGGTVTYEPTTRPPDASGYIGDCLPKVSTALTTQLTATSAAAGLDLTPKGSTEDTYYVEYGTDTSYGQTTTPVTVRAAFTAQSDAVPLATLQPCTTYHYQAVATNPDSDGGTSYGGDQTFTTTCLPPVATTGTPVSGSISGTQATVNVTVDPQAQATTYWVEYGTSTSYGQTTPATPLPATKGVQTATVSLWGLAACTTYHFAAMAQNAAGTSTGQDLTFTTTCSCTANNAANPPPGGHDNTPCNGDYGITTMGDECDEAGGTPCTCLYDNGDIAVCGSENESYGPYWQWGNPIWIRTSFSKYGGGALSTSVQWQLCTGMTEDTCQNAGQSAADIGASSPGWSVFSTPTDAPVLGIDAVNAVITVTDPDGSTYTVSTGPQQPLPFTWYDSSGWHYGKTINECWNYGDRSGVCVVAD